MLNNIRIFLVFAFMLPVIGVRADDGRSFSRQMNDIKRSGDYIYAESSAKLMQKRHATRFLK